MSSSSGGRAPMLTDSGKKKIDILLSNLPGDEDWFRDESDVQALRERLTSARISREMRWCDIFIEYHNLLEELVDGSFENEARYLMIIIIATGVVAIESAPRRHTNEHNQLKEVVYSAIRRCFRKMGSVGKLDNKFIQRHLGRARDGTQLLKSLDCHPFFSRIYELPYLVPVMLSLFLSLSYKGSKDYIRQEILARASKPPQIWDSASISIPDLVNSNLKGKVSLAAIHNLLDKPGTRQVVAALDEFWLIG